MTAVKAAAAAICIATGSLIAGVWASPKVTTVTRPIDAVCIAVGVWIIWSSRS